MSNILMSKEIKDEILVDEYDIGKIKLLREDGYIRKAKYITKHTKREDLPIGKYKLMCDNYEDDKSYWLIDGKLAVATSYNSKYDFAVNKRVIRNLLKNAVYRAVEVPKDRYELFNI